MASLTVVGAVVGLVTPFALGRAIDEVSRAHAARYGLIAAAIAAGARIGESAAYALSDLARATACARITESLRLRMGDRAEAGPTLVAHVISDADAVEQAVVTVLDQGVSALLDLTLPAIALAFVSPWLVGSAATAIVLAGVATRMLHRPVGAASHDRQESLEDLVEAATTGERFVEAVRATALSDRRLVAHAGIALQTSAAATAGVSVAVLATAITVGLRPGAAVAAFLLAQRAGAAAETLFDAGLDLEVARGAISRCLAFIAV